MKLYKDYFNSISVDDNLHRKIIAGIALKPRHRSTHIKRYAVAFTCLAVAVTLFGILSVAKLLPGGAPDLGAIAPTTIPELREDVLSLSEARSDKDFGAYIPNNVPAGFSFESSLRFKNQERDYLRVTWINDLDYIEWKVSYLADDDKSRITSAGQAENYDLSFYPIPYAESVPADLREIVTNPIFRIEELTREVVMARAYRVDDAGDTSGYRMRFSVLYGDVLVAVNIKGAEPELVYEMLTQF